MQALQEISEAIDQEFNERGVPQKINFHLLEAHRLRDAQAKQTAGQQRQGALHFSLHKTHTNNNH